VVVKARTYDEMALYVAEHPCPQCGTRTELPQLRESGSATDDGVHLIYTGSCRTCRTALRYEFDAPRRWPELPGFVYGGDEPSQLFTADDWRRLAEREAAGAPEQPDIVDAAGFYAAHKHLRAAIGMLQEAAKSGSAQPARLAALQDSLAEYNRVLPEVNAKAKAAMASAPPKVRMTKDAIAAHGRWLTRGRSGLHRLVVEDDSVGGLPLGNLNVAAAKLTRVSFDGSRVDFAHFEDAELIACSAIKTNFGHSVFDRARLDGCNFESASLYLTDFQDAVLVGTSLYAATANRGMWRRVRLSRCDMRDMRIGDCRLDGAVIEDCDLRGANLGRIEASLDLCTTTGAVFRRCDLRGAHVEGRRLNDTKFIDCQLAGIRGKPAIEGSYDVAGGDTPMAEIVKLWGPSP
jgi:uncharacterized protein YjbI with pentapeptide repeats